MDLEVQVNIQGAKENVWRVITDIENSVNVIEGIQKVEVLEKPAQGLLGLKWRETRIMFGKTATEVMWITDVKENESYTTRAESHGAVYTTHLSVTPENGTSVLKMKFGAVSQTFGAKVMYATMGWMFKSATIKALQQDLEDIKAAAEKM